MQAWNTFHDFECTVSDKHTVVVPTVGMSSIHITNDILMYMHDVAVTFMTTKYISLSTPLTQLKLSSAVVSYIFHFHEHSVKQRNSESSVNVVTKLQAVSLGIHSWYSTDLTLLTDLP
jgi:hypothetical protein